LKVLFLLWCRTKCISSIPGRTTVKPSTILGHLYAVKRVHEANGLEFLTKGQTTQAISYLAKEYELVHGAESLIPHKREGFTPSMVEGLLQSVDGLKLPSRKTPIISRGSWLARNLKAAIALSAGAGFRRSEVSVDERSEFTARDMSRASLFFIIRGRIVRCPSVANLQDMARRHGWSPSVSNEERPPGNILHAISHHFGVSSPSIWGPRYNSPRPSTTLSNCCSRHASDTSLHPNRSG
jgi:hypothetical protein